MKLNIRCILLALFLFGSMATGLQGQDVTRTQDPVLASPELVRFYSQQWEGPRMEDGRPLVDADLLERLKQIKVEDVWQFLNEAGYRNQFEGGWKLLHTHRPMTGQAMTAQFMPVRADVRDQMIDMGHAAGHIGPMNSWPIDQLKHGDIYVADAFGKIAQGTLIGDKLGNSIFARSGNGVIFDAALRDAETLRNIDGFNAFTRGWHPTFLQDVMLTGINVPVRIGEVTVMPGDVILAKEIGVVFIPPHLVEVIVITSEIVRIRDEFVHQRVSEGVYTAGQVDARWTQAIEEDFRQWLEDGRMHRLPVPYNEMHRYLEHRTW